MAQRGIRRWQIKRTLEDPERVELDRDASELRHALKRFRRRRGAMILRVVYNYTVKPVRVVTVFFERLTRRKR